MPARKNRPGKSRGKAPAPNSGTPRAQVERWAAEVGGYIYGNLGGGAFDVKCRDTYACLAYDRTTGLWSATHNFVPTKGDPLYRHATPGAAFSAYAALSSGVV